MLEFALIVPVVAVAFLASFSIVLVSARTLQAGSVSRIAGSVAASGQDPFSGAAKDQLLEAAKGLGLEKGRAAIFITEITRDASGTYKVVHRSSTGNALRWKTAIDKAEGIVELQSGERAWITEVFAESNSLAGIGPAELKVRNVS